MKYLLLTAMIALAGTVVQANPTIIGHRGAPFYAPENTTPSMQMAIDLGADGIETDIYLTADKKLMVLHDKTTSRTAAGVINLEIKKSNAADLAKVDVGAYLHPIWEGTMLPSLSQILEHHPKGKLAVIEIKDQPDTVAPLKELLESTGRPWSEYNIISFNFDTCVEARKLMPEVEVYYLESARDKQTKIYKNFTSAILKRAKDANLSGVDLDYHGVTEELVKECHDMGMKFYVWTVDDKEDVKRMTKFGVDSITTNRPDTARLYVEEALAEM